VRGPAGSGIIETLGDKKTESMEVTKGSIFLSYAGVDREAAAALSGGLSAAGANIWWDRDQIGWGDNWIDRLESGLSNCRAYLILIGRSGIRRWVKAELYVALRRHFEQELPIFPVLLPGVAGESLPPFLSTVQARSLAHAPQDLSPTEYVELAGVLETGRSERDRVVEADPYADCPFPGLEPYREEDARFFYGRQAEALELLRLLGLGLDGTYRRWVQVEGPSGVGKSSLVRAGLVPAVKRGWLEEGTLREWRIVTFRPGARPIEDLTAALERELASRDAPATLGFRLEELRRGQSSDALRYLLKVAVPEGASLLLVLDQLEEVFTLTEDEQERSQLDVLLAEALVDGPLHLVTTVRSDFLMRFAELPRLQAMLNERAGRYFLKPIGEAGLGDVVRTPARRVGLRWEDEATLIGQVMEDALAAGDGALPLVANLLYLLWKRSQQRGDGLLRFGDYRDLRGVSGALAHSANQLLASLDKECARRLLLALVKVSPDAEPTRCTVTREDALQAAGGGLEAEEVLLGLSGGRTVRAVGALRAAPRLIVVSPGEGGNGSAANDTVDLVHETLLRRDRHGQAYWKTLSDWVEQNREDLWTRDRALGAAEEWERSGRDRYHLWAQELLDPVYEALERLGRDRSTLDEPVRSFLRPEAERLEDELGDPATDHYRRAEIGDRLDRLPRRGNPKDPRKFTGDPRRGVGAREDGLPDIEWVAIPGGRVELEGMKGKFPVRPFQIARYPLTWTQYRAFTEDPHGYMDVAWWRDLKREDQPEEQYRRFGNCPADYVSWYDAMAYCRWLTVRLRERNLLAASTVIRLPTEWEWQQAATGGSPVNTYPWGPDWDAGRANIFESGLGRTTAVGMYPAGTWEGGPLDLAGNIWEWCLNKHDEPAVTDADESEHPRAVRGGCWLSPADDTESSFRQYAFHPDLRYVYVGSRVCCAFSLN
jgi:formylglycine-generating enzyme required for sulfatase activity